MRGDESWHSSGSGIVIAVAILALLVVAMLLGRAPEQPPMEMRYLHQRPGKTEAYLGPADAAMQAKGIAASRHRSPEEVRQLIEDCTEDRGVETLGHQRINIEHFNRRLDERWPTK